MGRLSKLCGERGKDVCGNLTRMARELKEWSHKRFGEFAQEMRACKNQMGKLMKEEQTKETIVRMHALDARMDELEK